MLSSIRAIDATSPVYESAEEVALKAHKATVVQQRRSFKDLVHQNQLPPSPSDSNTTDDQMSKVSALKVGERRITQPIDRGAPGDQAIFSEAKTPEQRELSKRRSQYYGEAFAYRESNSSARERISRESLIMADVRTNVIIEDEYSFITDLSYNLSTRYQRPQSSILVTVSHSACLLLGGSFDPAYTMTITALQSHLQPVTNKRNAALLQKAMEDAMGVPPDRGLIKFMPIPEENMATNGKTVAGEIEDLERQTSEENSSLKRTLSRGSTKTKNRLSTKSMRNLKISSPLPTHDEQMTPPSSAHFAPPVPAIPTEKATTDRRAEKVRKMGRRKSFMASVFGKG